jgi:hypothetical protein
MPVPVSRGIKPNSIDLESVGNAKQPACRLLNRSGIEFCRLQSRKTLIADKMEPGGQKNRISPIEIIWVARLITIQNQAWLCFVQPWSQHMVI